MVDHNGQVVIVLNGDEAWDVFLRLVYSPQADSPLIESALRKFAAALGSDWALIPTNRIPLERTP
ncbi:MAG: hypothetical protein ACO1SV_23100 [Fimbriimonas sp.]